jgi:hypothetical protein
MQHVVADGKAKTYEGESNFPPLATFEELMKVIPKPESQIP